MTQAKIEQACDLTCARLLFVEVVLLVTPRDSLAHFTNVKRFRAMTESGPPNFAGRVTGILPKALRATDTTWRTVSELRRGVAPCFRDTPVFVFPYVVEEMFSNPAHVLVKFVTAASILRARHGADFHSTVTVLYVGLRFGQNTTPLFQSFASALSKRYFWTRGGALDNSNAGVCFQEAAVMQQTQVPTDSWLSAPLNYGYENMTWQHGFHTHNYRRTEAAIVADIPQEREKLLYHRKDLLQCHGAWPPRLQRAAPRVTLALRQRSRRQIDLAEQQAPIADYVRSKGGVFDWSRSANCRCRRSFALLPRPTCSSPPMVLTRRSCTCCRPARSRWTLAVSTTRLGRPAAASTSEPT